MKNRFYLVYAKRKNKIIEKCVGILLIYCIDEEDRKWRLGYGQEVG